ncbi:MAG: DNA replication/repair protein RecF [Peptococcaceae bacterium]|nr:DNA replication/repair protein RecF [Peptococcaceae bacterium]
MLIKDFYLRHFRNYQEQKIEFQPGINLLAGPNGQGKTNVLEGIYYLLTGKSYRVKSENELILWGEKNFYLQASFDVMNRMIKLESYYETGKKVMKINQFASKRLSDYVGTVNAVFFSPEDLNIVKSSPQERRRFLDLLIAQVKPGHISILNSYLKAIRQKNNLLKRDKSTNSLRSQIQAWNEELVEFGTKILTNRWQFTEILNQYCRPIFNNIFSDQDNMELFYFGLGKKSLSEALEIFPDLLEKKMDQEIEKKSVLIGPHRDDLIINLNGRPAKIFGSQGQQRSLVLCLKLAEMEIIRREKEEYPILLLDDVLSELDEFRRQYLLDYIHITGKQTIITMTGADEKIINSQKSVFRVSNGKIWREQ